MINVNLNIISGQIPASLNGIFLRVGPNEIPSHGFKKSFHWFDGHGMIHSIRITNQTAKYSNEYIPTTVYTIEKNLGSNFFFRIGEFGGFLGLFKALVLAPFKLSSTGVTPLTRSHANTALNVFHDRIFANEEVGYPFEIQLNRDLTFSAVGFETFGDQINFPITAHPKIMSDGKMYFDGYNPVPKVGSTRKYGSVSKNTETSSISLLNYFHVNTPVPAFAHDMAVTADHVCICIHVYILYICMHIYVHMYVYI
jgi:carotenoid cleavage dioxygenase